ncbi:hypothetical protein OG689_41255 [Kitasatospora sp. NBC_00240]|uniref:hypothetical protein n=1 Tax=Kitasatospora sp. NBC_00240 TaxID=2903567 RepID=UPI00224FFFEA|nr:hypothetical protein [Kitasatospora sp. NBC_00240]MCX5215584.1 hypothetical protein [Kitasatospora sp. NBC_00240]
MTPSPDGLEAVRTPASGWTRAHLVERGVPWPPPNGWKELADLWEAEQACSD